MSKDLKDTLNLPTTNFPMRANLVERELTRIESWEKMGLYEKIQEKNRQGSPFILHDGPPFTNGDVHIGTALNKILKDVILRYKSMCGFRTPYIPGWDCHGLPIEHKVATQLRSQNALSSSASKNETSPLKNENARLQQSGRILNNAHSAENKVLQELDFDALTLRKKCANFSSEYIEKLQAQFKRLGVLAPWNQAYKTMDPAYEGTVLNTFAEFVEKGLIYRSKKPVYWSIPCATALAEAEIEYKTHTSDSIWVAFPIIRGKTSSGPVQSQEPVFFVIWTTTPWTIPANLAIALHPALQYCELSHDGKTYIVADRLVDNFIQACKWEGARRGAVHHGKDLENLKVRHPLIDRISRVVLAEYVTVESGTGCVHTAPGHGPDDYLTGLKYGLEIYAPVDDRGCFVDDGQMPSALVGLSLLSQGKQSEANRAVIELLKESGHLLKATTCEHAYPFCWRSKTPLIFRALDQWFVSLDKDNLRERALRAIDDVQWIPHWGINRIKGAVESRPDWCISRQRSWGIPLPAFYDEAGNAYLNARVIRSIAKKVEQCGTDFWFEQEAKEILAGIELPGDWQGKYLLKGRDTLDVWIDSGCSHRAVLKKNSTLAWPADLYFEGSDQHRGWFQSSLWTAMVTEKTLPYKAVITHGFIVGEDKKKISKSDGKPQNASDYVKKYGADVLRLWIVSEDYRSDIPLSDKIIEHVVQTYRTIRNTLRFQLGNLNDFDIHRDKIEVESMTAIDRWVLHQTIELIESVRIDYENYEFHRAYQSINRFCAVTLSATYHDILKDRLYTYAPNSKERRSSQTAIYSIFHTLIHILAPILTFTCEEAFAFSQNDSDFAPQSIHLQDWPKIDESWRALHIFEGVEAILKVRNKVNEKLEVMRQSKVLGQSLDAHVILNCDSEGSLLNLLKQYEASLPEFFIVSQVSIQEKCPVESHTELKEPAQDDSNMSKPKRSSEGRLNGDIEDRVGLAVEIVHARGERCPRSWRWVDELVETEAWGRVSRRCRDALTEKLKYETAHSRK